MEGQFEEFVKQLQPNPGYMRLYREIVLDVWRKKQGNSQQLQGVVSRRVKWKAAPIEQKQRLQQVLFPKGVNYSDGKFRTAVTCLLFNGVEEKEVKKSRLVALPGIEPGF
jgi:hypothetical protein